MNVFEHFNNFPLLLAGRVMGGVPCHKLLKTEVIDFHHSLFDITSIEVSTSLLFSAFESGCLGYPYFSSSHGVCQFFLKAMTLEDMDGVRTPPKGLP